MGFCGLESPEDLQRSRPVIEELKSRVVWFESASEIPAAICQLENVSDSDSGDQDSLVQPYQSIDSFNHQMRVEYPLRTSLSPDIS